MTPISDQNNTLVDEEFDTTDHQFTDPSIYASNPHHDSLPSSSHLGFLAEGEYYSSSRATLQYISDMLMEEDLENKPCMFHDCLAQLQAAEKSLQDALLVQQYPSSASNDILASSIKYHNVEDADEFIHHSTNSSTSASNWDAYSDWLFFQNVPEFSHVDSTTILVPSLFSPNGKGQSTSLQSNSSFLEQPTGLAEGGSKSKKNHRRDQGDYYLEQERSSKQSASYVYDDDDESEPAEMLDDVLLYPKSCFPPLHESDQLNEGSGPRRTKRKETGKKKEDGDSEVVDFQALLTRCAKSVASYDIKTANEQLKQIRQHSSPHGDGTQRLAHYIANGLEERLTAAAPLYIPLSSSKISAATLLKVYQTYIKACPFKLMSNFYANRTIFKLAENATRLHIIDFGILYGYQWPCLIEQLARRPYGPPLLRITGIEFPQSGFRPSGRLEETGRRLAKYCRRFNVPFEYNFIAQNWETIQYEAIKLDKDELTVVNCLYRLKNLPDDTEINSPRDTVLKLIRRLNPDMFIHGVVNGTYNAPFFNIRFREALYHFSSLFDVFEETLPREDQHRLLYEQEVYGRDIIDVIACEGSRRLDRPETYKQWKIRNTRAGFKQLPSNQEILTQTRNMIKLDYHRDFVIDEDGKWIFQGWKGRIIYALSCWKWV